MTSSTVVLKIACGTALLVGTTLAWTQSGLNDLVRAPIVGLVYNNQVTISIKGDNEGRVRLEYRRDGDSQATISGWQSLNYSENFTTDFLLTPIKPNTAYDYRLEFESGFESQWYRFSTFPPQGKPGRFNFVFSACAREREKPHPIFSHIEGISPTFVALLGDNMYADYDGDVNAAPASDVLDMFRQKYRRNLDEHFQKMSSAIPIVAIWDDHDYGQDNSDRNYRYKQVARDALKETFPDYAYIVEDGGLYYKFTIADVDFFALDARWYRSPMQDQDGPQKTMLGSEQLTWLLRELRESASTFKIVFSSVSLNDYGGDTSSGRAGYDSWMDYKFERDQILSAITQNQIHGVMLFSGDQHYPSAHILNWNAPLTPIEQTATSVVYSLRELGTAVFDFSASPLHYRRAIGEPLIAERQLDPRYSFEIYRADWGRSENKTPEVVTSVYGLAEIDTESAIKKVTVKFLELNSKSGDMDELYRIDVTFP